MQKNKNNFNRNPTIDSLRAIAALSVFLCHIWGEPFGNYISFGSTGVILFFLISGYCIVSSLDNLGENPVRDFLIRRVFRLYPVYWIAVLLGGITFYANISLYQFITNFTMLQKIFHEPNVIGVFWTLYVEINFYGFIIILLALKQTHKKSIYGQMCIILLVSGLILLSIKLINGHPARTSILAFLTLFFFGGWCAMTYKLKLSVLKKKDGCFIIGYLSLIFVIGKLLIGGYPAAYAHHFNNYFVAISIFIISIERRMFEYWWLSYIGKISYCIYLFHIPVFLLLQHFVSNFIFLFFLSLISTLLISLFIYRSYALTGR